jgi:hypothetical protein
MYRTIIGRLGQTLGSPTPWLFLLGAIAVGLLGEGASKVVDAWRTGTSTETALYTLLSGILVLLGTIVLFNVPLWLRLTLSQPRQASIAVEEHVPHQRALIALVSLGSYVPAENALDYHSWAGVPGSKPTLTHCWLLAGPGEGEQSSQRNAGRLAEVYAAKGITTEIWPLNDADDTEEVYRAVKLIYQLAQSKYKLPREEIIADYTGGTKSMTAGMVLAVIEQGGQLQYMKPNKYEVDGRADRAAGSRPQLVLVNFVTVDEVG